LLGSIPISDWKIYFKAKTLATYADVWSTPFESAEFEVTKILFGHTIQITRAQIMVQKVDRKLGFALEQRYVDTYFNENAKKKSVRFGRQFAKSF
jgi:putative endopeptidase